MPDQSEREARKELLEEKIAPIAVGLLTLAEEFQADIFFVVDAPQLGLYERIHRVQRLTTVERLAAELKEVQADTAAWSDARLSAEE